jgi:hypothetical protein
MLDLSVARRYRIHGEPRMRFRDQRIDLGLERRKVLGPCGVHTRAHEVVRQTGMQDSIGRQRAGTLREYDSLDADLVCDRRCVKPRRAAEGDHSELSRVEALLE